MRRGIASTIVCLVGSQAIAHAGTMPLLLISSLLFLLLILLLFVPIHNALQVLPRFTQLSLQHIKAASVNR